MTVHSERHPVPRRALAISLAALAVPVAPSDTIARIAREVDEIVVLHEPGLFFAIGGFYSEFPQVEDGVVVELLRKR